jgi:TRAP-type C4-dicarboxylate transport system permease small subunit
MRKFYHAFCKVEETVCGILLVIITALVFLSAVARTIKHPINWAQDVSLLLFAWVVFLGADAALRKADFVNVDMLVLKFPKKLQNALYLLWYGVILVFLLVLIRYGIPLSIESSKRLFQTLGISYSWAVISVPVGFSFMSITIVLKVICRLKEMRNIT